MGAYVVADIGRDMFRKGIAKFRFSKATVFHLIQFSFEPMHFKVVF